MHSLCLFPVQRFASLQADPHFLCAFFLDGKTCYLVSVLFEPKENVNALRTWLYCWMSSLTSGLIWLSTSFKQPGVKGKAAENGFQILKKKLPGKRILQMWDQMAPLFMFLYIFSHSVSSAGCLHVGFVILMNMFLICIGKKIVL